MPGYAGLQTNLFTWLIMGAMTGWWIASIGFAPGWSREGWPSLLKSVYGLVWIGFGVDIVLRFLMLAYNAVEWGNNTLRLVAQTTDTVNATLLYCGLFWLLVTVAYAFAVRRKGAGPLTLTREITVEFVYQAAIPIALLGCVAFYLTEGPGRLPVALITPLALLANLYMVPAVIVWWDHFQQTGPKWRISSVHIIVLLPALVRGWMSPYRENLAPILLIPLIAALFAGQRPSLRKVIPVGLICLLLVSSLVRSYRRVKWENVRPQEVVSEIRQAGLVGWLTGASDEPMQRFHAFDSMLLTVDLVPGLQPYSGRNLLMAPLIRGFIPRFIYQGKGVADAGISFGTRIWAFDNPIAREQSGASIAPSMPGDLFDAGGVLYVVVGGLMWGALLGLVDGWKGHLPAFCAAAVTILVATQCAMSVERDFDNSLSSFIQTLLVFVLTAGLIALARRRNPEFAMKFEPLLTNPTMERS
jgi:hypothetical protein